jgi:uncharacterized tellurite resistance protein B-like protein
MLDGIRSFFESSMELPEDADPRDREAELRLASSALLLEIAHADDDFTEAERQHLCDAVRRHFGLDRLRANELVRMAEREREKAVDLWQFTRLINGNYSPGQKMVLCEIMWGLVYADGELSGKEDYLMRRICNLLDVQPGYLAEARRRAREEPLDAPPAG